MILMAYPEWVLKYKKKGTYINKVGNNYYLYAAHSEHVPGTANKARRVCDGYLGKITETDGFIPKKQKASPVSLEYGLSCAITSLCKKPFQRIEHDYPNTFKEILIRSILRYIYEENVNRLQHLSFISSLISKDFVVDEQTEFLIQRTTRMIQSILRKTFPDSDDLFCFISEMRCIQIIKLNNDWVISKFNRNVNDFIASNHMDFVEDDLWKKLQK